VKRKYYKPYELLPCEVKFMGSRILKVESLNEKHTSSSNYSETLLISRVPPSGMYEVQKKFPRISKECSASIFRVEE
jgi:hypothetical protein